MESELARYRARRRLEDQKATARAKVYGIWENFTNRLTRALLPNSNTENEDDATNNTESEENNEIKNSTRRKVKKKERVQGLNEASSSNADHENLTPASVNYLNYFQLGLKCLIWLFTWFGFIKCGWGSVFFVISGLVFIWRNLRSGKSVGEPSAYSVFNPGCEELDGTLSAAKLEKQLLFR